MDILVLVIVLILMMVIIGVLLNVLIYLIPVIAIAVLIYLIVQPFIERKRKKEEVHYSDEESNGDYDNDGQVDVIDVDYTVIDEEDTDKESKL